MDWLRWKHAMAAYAGAYDLVVPVHFSALTDSCGTACHSLIRRVQIQAHLTVDGVLGPNTKNHLAPFLEPVEWRRRMLHICASALTGEGNQEWHYRQWRPYPRSWKLGESLFTDCSGSTEMLCLMAGAADPSGWGFNGAGSTVSIGAHARRIDRALARPGDMVLWSGHIAILLKPGPDPLLFSHGFEGGPLAIRLSVEDRYHSGSPVFLRNVGR